MNTLPALDDTGWWTDPAPTPDLTADDDTPDDAEQRTGRTRIVNLPVLTPLDYAILRELVRWHMLRGWHLAAMTGASPYTIRTRLTRLRDAGLVRLRKDLYVDLYDAEQDRIRESKTSVYIATHAGTRAVAESWTVPGHDDVLVDLKAPKPSGFTTHHVLGVADLAAHYAWHRFQVISEREIVHLEDPRTPNGNARAAKQHWAIKTNAGAGKKGSGVHPPDLAAVGPNGESVVVELERAKKTLGEYVDIIGNYRSNPTHPRIQVWHVLDKATFERLIQACTSKALGMHHDTLRSKKGLWVSHDGTVRLEKWFPGPILADGRSGKGGPGNWPLPDHLTAPGAFESLHDQDGEHVTVEARKAELMSQWPTGGGQIIA